MPRPEGFAERYTREEMVILSRHNIRSPLSGPGSVLSRIPETGRRRRRRPSHRSQQLPQRWRRTWNRRMQR